MGASVWSPSTTTVVPITPTTPVVFKKGTAALPGITFEGDEDTGVWSSNDNTIDFTVGTLNSAQVDPLGNLVAVANKLVSKGEVDVASAATVDLGSATSNLVQITGTTNINSFGTTYKGPIFIRFAASLILANSASLSLPSAGNITTAAGDTCIAVPKSTSGTPDGWKILAYAKFDGTPLAVSSTALWGVTNVTVATTLTSANTVAKCAPTNYGVPISLADARTCVRGLLHIIDNSTGTYPVKVVNASGALVGFVHPGKVGNLTLTDNTTVAGTWALDGGNPVGCSAVFFTSLFTTLYATVALDSTRELLVGGVAGSSLSAVVFDRSANTFGTPATIRSASITADSIGALLVSANKVIVTSCVGTAMEAVNLTITGSSIAVGTAGTATLSSAFSVGASDGTVLTAVGSSGSFSYLYQTAGLGIQIRGIDASGAIPVISAIATLTGTSLAIQIAVSSSVVFTVSLVSGAAMHAATYTISGSSTPSLGTDSSYAAGSTGSVKRVGIFSSGRVYTIVTMAAAGNTVGTVFTLSGATISATSSATAGTSGCNDATVVGANKLLITSNNNPTLLFIFTDTSGTMSVGSSADTGISSSANRVCLQVSGTNVYVHETNQGCIVDCSGATPSVSTVQSFTSSNFTVDFIAGTRLNNPYVTTLVNSSGFAQNVGTFTSASPHAARVRNMVFRPVSDREEHFYSSALPTLRGVANSEVWGVGGSVSGSSRCVFKLECATA